MNHLPFVRNVRIRGGNKPAGLPEGVSMIYEKLGGDNLVYDVEADLDVAALYAFMNEKKEEDHGHAKGHGEGTPKDGKGEGAEGQKVRQVRVRDHAEGTEERKDATMITMDKPVGV